MKSTQNFASCRPVLRWAGSKRQSLSVLSKYWKREHERYVEPFAGSCALFFHLAPAAAILGDSNSDLVSTYLVLSKRPRDLYASLSGIPCDKRTYNLIRAFLPRDLNRFERASRFIYLNRYCFNGIYRTNLMGRFNVPYSGYETGALPSESTFVECSKLLRRANIIAGDFSKTLTACKRGDFVYLDPPYAIAGRRMFREYGPRSFETADLVRLGRELERLNKIGASFLLSYADCKEITPYSAVWNTRRHRVKRNVAGFAARRRHSFEVLLSNID